MKYQVWSMHEDVGVLEVIRTSKAVAYEDRNIIQDILGRKAWVVETGNV